MHPASIIECPPTIQPHGLAQRTEITFCGEAPGWQEVRDREGFVGGSGHLLDRVCFASSIDLSKANKTNVAKRRPPGDNFGAFYEDPLRRTRPTPELIWWRQLLIAELTKYKPNLVSTSKNHLRCGLPAICSSHSHTW